MRWLFAIVLLFGSTAIAETVDPTTRELMSIINERNLAYDQRFNAQEKAVSAALAAAKEAVTKAESSAEKRFDSVNEFRATLKDQQSTLIPRIEAEVRLKAIENKIADNEARIIQIVSRAEATSQLWQGIAVVLGIAFAGITLFFKFRDRERS